MTLVEAAIALTMMAVFLLGFLGTFLQSRRLTEGSVMDSVATSLMYGLVEQMKELSYDTMLPISGAVDPDQAVYDAFPGSGKSLPYIRVRLNRDQATWLQCTFNTNTAALSAPQEAPSSTSTLDAAMCNTVGPLALSSVSGGTAQQLTLKVWVWVDAIANNAQDVADAKCVTLVYAYDVNVGGRTRTMIKRETFIRAPLYVSGSTS
jgi:Tfp pilus assembly protein PilV